jgi:hypothetical protein
VGYTENFKNVTLEVASTYQKEIKYLYEMWDAMKKAEEAEKKKAEEKAEKPASWVTNLETNLRAGGGKTKHKQTNKSKQ